MRRVSITPHSSQTRADIKAEYARSDEFMDHLRERGVEEWRSEYRWVGPVKMMMSKEVGPPPWRWPQGRVKLVWRSPLSFHATVGWRSTAYGLGLMWAGRR